jgi:hypothetical protein
MKKIGKSFFSLFDLGQKKNLEDQIPQNFFGQDPIPQILFWTRSNPPNFFSGQDQKVKKNFFISFSFFFRKR